MPIDYSKYPDNWKTHIRPAVLERAGNCCEWCGAKNGGPAISKSTGREYPIILTIAHLDHDLSNNDMMDSGNPAMPLEKANLVALCQPCHLGHDAADKARRRQLNPDQMEIDFENPQIN